MRHRARVDANQREIVEAMRAVGATVEVLSDVGRGVPDLMVGWRGRTLLMEVKRDRRASLTADQQTWWSKWRGSPPIRVETVDDALEALGIHRRRGMVTVEGPQLEALRRKAADEAETPEVEVNVPPEAV